jgi:Domain of unknown function (DUF4863)
MPVQLEAFTDLIAALTSRIAAKPLDATLEQELNRTLSPAGSEYQQLVAACRSAIAAGWMCNRETGGIRFGRVIKPGPRTHGFSVDVVDMDNVAGPHHAHPNGEIDLIMPLTSDARFDGHGAGWCVYGPGSAHRPTVTQGRALILYLLPEGKIEFTKR